MNKKAGLIKLFAILGIAVIFILLIVKVGNLLDKDDKPKIPTDINSKAIKSCTDYGLKYLVHYKNNTNRNYHVICYQSSPLKHFWKVVS